MSIPKKGSRKIVVDGVGYRWMVRGKPTYAQGLAESGLRFAAEQADVRGATLLVEIPYPRPDNWLGDPGVTITPGYVAQVIRIAIGAGWQPDTPGKTFELGPDGLPDLETTGDETA